MNGNRLAAINRMKREETHPAPLLRVPSTAPARGRPRRTAKPEERADAQRMHLLHAAAEVFAERGYFDSSVEDIIGRAGMSRGTFYRLFENRQDILAALYEVVSTRIQEEIERVVTVDQAPLEKLEIGITTYVEILASDPGLARVLLVETRAAGTRLAAARERAHKRFVANVADAIGELVAAGDVEEPHPLIPRVLVGIVDDTFADCLAKGKDPRTAVPLIIDIHMRLIGPPPPPPPPHIAGRARQPGHVGTSGQPSSPGPASA